MLDDSGNDYTAVEYWDSRFQDEEVYEWIADFKQFAKLVTDELKESDKILHVGCGNSQLSFQIAECGFKHITNLDYSSVLIDKFSKVYPEMKWVCEDMRTLRQLPDNSFDVVIEKAAIESLLAKEKSVWTFSESAQSDLRATLASIHRVLKPGGIFISISFTPPYFRVPYLIEQQWDCRVQEFGDTFHFYCYKLTKDAAPDMADLERFLRVTR